MRRPVKVPRVHLEGPDGKAVCNVETITRLYIKTGDRDKITCKKCIKKGKSSES